MQTVEEPDTDLAPGYVRVYAHAGVGPLRGGRWGDVRAHHPMLPGWRAAGLVTDVGPNDEEAPAKLRRGGCGCGK